VQACRTAPAPACVIPLYLSYPCLCPTPVSVTATRYALTCCSYFAKDFPRLLAAKSAHSWDPYDVEELRGKTMGVVGYGDIGQACARLARAFRMRVVALRRNTQLSAAEQAEGVVVSVAVAAVCRL
jgi:phosphoglycerate dehydrogenase-like enzyme